MKSKMLLLKTKEKNISVNTYFIIIYMYYDNSKFIKCKCEIFIDIEKKIV